mgnify:CR=1 FL=1
MEESKDESLHPGHVLGRFKFEGRLYKYIVRRPLARTTCEICFKKDLFKAVRLEQGNTVCEMFCFECLPMVMNSKNIELRNCVTVNK